MEGTRVYPTNVETGMPFSWRVQGCGRLLVSCMCRANKLSKSNNPDDPARPSCTAKLFQGIWSFPPVQAEGARSRHDPAQDSTCAVFEPPHNKSPAGTSALTGMERREGRPGRFPLAERTPARINQATLEKEVGEWDDARSGGSRRASYSEGRRSEKMIACRRAREA